MQGINALFLLTPKLYFGFLIELIGMSLSKEEKEHIKKLGENIVSIRKKKGLKQKELSDLLDMDDGSLRRIESGRTNPTTTTLLSIANALKIDMSELFNFSKEK